MGAFSPFKKHANKFNYKPRYYDPAKEAREQRRAELSGKRSDSKEEYKPGNYIKSQSAARSAKRKHSGSGRSSKTWLMVGALAALTYFGILLYNKLIDIFVPSARVEQNIDGTDMKRANKEFDEFDPYAPITVVPNDYNPNK